MATQIELTDNGLVAALTFEEESADVPCTLDHAVLDRIDFCLAQLELQSDRIRALVVQSSSPKYFVVGANIKALQELNPDTIIAWVEKGHRVFNRLQQLPFPVLAKIEGYALGGGLELAMACDMIIAGERAKFGQPEASLGVMSGWGASYRLPMRVGPAKAKQMLFTGKIITAATALSIGLVNEVAPSEKLDEMVSSILDDICRNDASAIAYTKQIINQTFGGGISRNCLDEAATSALCLHSTATQKRLQDFFDSRK